VKRATAVVFSASGGHLQRLLPLIAGLVQRGFEVHVMTRPEGRAQTEAAGARFFDLYARFPLEAADAESIPLPSRLVSFAAVYAEPLIAEVAALRPSLIVYDSFVVAAPLVARRLGVPYVGMRAGHAQVPARAIAETRADPRVAISAACIAAVETLRERYGVADASPFSFLDGLSPHLNLCAEPPRFLEGADRADFEPVAFFGSLAPERREAESKQRPLAGAGEGLRVYVSFGTVIWRYYAPQALAVLARLAEALSRRGARALLSLGNHAASPAERSALARPGVRVESYVDQWGALRDADLFVTHHGLNSTHEAIFHRVPMLSYPFFGDQPEMARTCQRLGLAVALAEAPRAELETSRVERSIDTILDQLEAFTARLAEARSWELDVIAGRERVLDRVTALARNSA
jgi:MGT family glycosyltransferase